MTLNWDGCNRRSLRPEVLEAMSGAFHTGGNAASLHGLGRAARRLLDDARDAIAKTAWDGARLIFVAGCNEAHALVQSGLDQPPRRIDAPFPEDALTDLENEPGGVVVDLSWGISRHPGPWPSYVKALVLGGEGLGAPPGVAALILRRGFEPKPLWHGGGQERGIRSGTVAVPLAVGLAKALEMSRSSEPAAVELSVMLRLALRQSGNLSVVSNTSAPQWTTWVQFPPNVSAEWVAQQAQSHALRLAVPSPVELRGLGGVAPPGVVVLVPSWDATPADVPVVARVLGAVAAKAA